MKFFHLSDLVQMTSGEFILLCRDVKNLENQGQAGLDLDIYHMASDSVRDVKTLSGGESFMASLSMALGLSDVVQNTAGAVRLDTIVGIISHTVSWLLSGQIKGVRRSGDRAGRFCLFWIKSC